MLTIIITAIYMVAFLLNRRAGPLLITFLCAEYVGWATIFSWSEDVYYGMLTHLMWGMIYASYLLLCKPNDKLLKLCGAMVLFQLIMSVDCWSCDGDKTYLFISYKYILVVIHCCIVSTFIQRRRIISILGYITSAFRAVSTNYGFNVGFWYNQTINHKP
jgi:hypothetical protein